MNETTNHQRVTFVPQEQRRAHGVLFFADALTSRHFLTTRTVIATLSIALMALLVGCNEAADVGDSQTPEAPLTVGTVPAELVEGYERERIYTGVLVAQRRSALSFERAGKLIELVADEGDVVQQGQTLAQLDQRRIRASHDRASAELAQARAVLAELIEGPRKETIAAARAEVRNLTAQREIAQRNLDRRRELVDTRAISQEEFDEALFLTEAATARAEAAQKQLDELVAGTRVEQIDAQEALVKALEARLADIDHEIDDTVLTAPFDGVIATRQLDEGEVVNAGSTVLELVGSKNLEAWIGLPPNASSMLSVGERHELTIRGELKQATVYSLRPELDPNTRTRNAIFRLEDSGDLVPGQVVRVGLSEYVPTPGYWVPTDALTPRKRGLWAVYVVDDSGVASRRDVELIETQGDRSFVRGTLTEGEKIIAVGAHRVVAGQRVQARSGLIASNDNSPPPSGGGVRGGGASGTEFPPSPNPSL